MTQDYGGITVTLYQVELESSGSTSSATSGLDGTHYSISPRVYWRLCSSSSHAFTCNAWKFQAKIEDTIDTKSLCREAVSSSRVSTGEVR
jgi:hypothetical protein